MYELLQGLRSVGYFIWYMDTNTTHYGKHILFEYGFSCTNDGICLHDFFFGEFIQIEK